MIVCPRNPTECAMFNATDETREQADLGVLMGRRGTAT